MYVMQSMPSEQQALAGGIFNTLFRLAGAIALGTSSAVFTSTSGTPEALVDAMVPYKHAFLVSIGLSAASFLFLPFVRLGTQGNSGPDDTKTDNTPSPTITTPTPGQTVSAEVEKK